MAVDLPVSGGPYVDTRGVGEATVTVVSDGALLWGPRYPVAAAEWRRELPEADERGRVWLGLNVVLIRLGDALIVVDPGCDDPDSAWQRRLPAAWPDEVFARSPGLTTALAGLGIAPEDVTHVVITHPHGDHYPGIAVERDGDLQVRFPRARHFLGRADWDGHPARGQPSSDFARLELVDRAGLLDLVDERREIVPGLTILAAPGETPGHCVIRLESAGQVCFILGDVIHHPCEIAHDDWMPPGRDPETLAATRARFFAAAAAGDALVIHAHDQFPPWSRIVASEGGYRWERL